MIDSDENSNTDTAVLWVLKNCERKLQISHRILTDSCKFPTGAIIITQNFNFVPEFPQNRGFHYQIFAFLKKNDLTKKFFTIMSTNDKCRCTDQLQWGLCTSQTQWSYCICLRQKFVDMLQQNIRSIWQSCKEPNHSSMVRCYKYQR